MDHRRRLAWKTAGRRICSSVGDEGNNVMSGMRVFCGNANRPLAEEICRYLGIQLGDANTTRFSDGEFNYQINENVRGRCLHRSADLPAGR